MADSNWLAEDDGKSPGIPEAVRIAAGTSMDSHSLQSWWFTPSEAFGGFAPSAFSEEKVVEYIKSSKQFDMA